MCLGSGPILSYGVKLNEYSIRRSGGSAYAPSHPIPPLEYKKHKPVCHGFVCSTFDRGNDTKHGTLGYIENALAKRSR
jgi:hypothetical protein